MTSPRLTFVATRDVPQLEINAVMPLGRKILGENEWLPDYLVSW